MNGDENTEITGDELPTRWEIELEFVQSLANIQYVNYLAQNGYFNSAEFLNYLKYLNYWKQPLYAKYLVYPNCLHILTLLQTEEFRKNIVNPEFMNTVMNDMVKRWQDEPQEQPQQVQDNAQNPQEQSEPGHSHVSAQQEQTDMNGTESKLPQIQEPERIGSTPGPESIPSLPNTVDVNNTVDETMVTASGSPNILEPPVHIEPRSEIQDAEMSIDDARE